MPDFRLYRLAFAPAMLAFVAMMFSLQGVPPPLEPAVPPSSFEPSRAAATARAIASAAPERPPGSPGDAEIADLVTERFAAVRAGTVSEQELTASVDGDDVALRNVLITLPGDSAATVAVLAERSSARGPGAASTAAATGALVELAAALGVSGHAKTYVLASTSGGTDGGADGAAVIDALPDPAALEAVVVLSQPGSADPRPPFVVATSTGANRAPAQLVTTAVLAVEERAGFRQPGPGALAELARLAFPSGIGPQAPLIDAGVDAIAISSAGERPLEPGEDTPEDLTVRSLGGFGRAATSVVQALDIAEAPLRRGPEPYVEVAGNLVPGWSIAVLALALLLPAFLAAADATARALRRNEELAGALAWAGARTAPILAGLAAIYALTLVGIVPRPSFPFAPWRFEIGGRAVVAIALIGIAIGAAGVVAPARVRAPGAPRASLAAAAGILSCAAGLIAWLSNPYFALLAVPAAHVWLAVAAGSRLAPTVGAAALSLFPLGLALAEVASALGLRGDAPWTFLIMIADGQIGFWTASSLCLLAGGLVAAIAASRRDPSPPGAVLGAGP